MYGFLCISDILNILDNGKINKILMASRIRECFERKIGRDINE